MDNQNHKNTFKEVFSDIEINRAIRILSYLEKTLCLGNELVLYVAGSTYREKDSIDNIKNQCSVEIIKNKSTRAGIKKILPFPMPTYFVIKILDPKSLNKIFKLLDDHLLIEFFIFNKKEENKFLLEVKDAKSYRKIQSIKEDSQYLIYGIDLDNQESSTGIMELISYGVDTPKELTSFL